METLIGFHVKPEVNTFPIITLVFYLFPFFLDHIVGIYCEIKFYLIISHLLIMKLMIMTRRDSLT